MTTDDRERRARKAVHAALTGPLACESLSWLRGAADSEHGGLCDRLTAAMLAFADGERKRVTNLLRTFAGYPSRPRAGFVEKDMELPCHIIRELADDIDADPSVLEDPPPADTPPALEPRAARGQKEKP